MDFKSIGASVVSSVVFGVITGYVVVHGEVQALEARQEDLIAAQRTQDQNMREEIRELRKGQNEILRYLRDSK